MSLLELELKVFLNNISAHESLFFQISTHLKNHNKNLLNTFKYKNPNDPYMGSSLVIGDITGVTEGGFKIIYPSGFSPTIHFCNLEKSIDQLVRIEGMRILATCYEILETLIYDLTACFLKVCNKNYAAILNKNLHLENDLLTLKTDLRKYYRSKNNKEILNLIRKLSPEFKKSEMTNNRTINIKEWYELISKIRHSIVHSLFTVKNYRQVISNSQLALLNSLFTTKIEGVELILTFTKNEIQKQIQFIAEYGFLLFKCLCSEIDCDWKVLKNMN